MSRNGDIVRQTDCGGKKERIKKEIDRHSHSQSRKTEDRQKSEK